jgi:predicted O-methyltransferase YrrM
MGERVSARTLQPEMKPHELECLLATIRASRLQGNFLEIGTAAGGTLCQMMRCYDDATRPHFVVLDPMRYFPGQIETVKRNLDQNGLSPDSVEFRVGNTDSELPRAQQAHEKFDFIFIDGNHKISYVTRDLGWAGLLNVGGLLCCHDYDPANPAKRGVRLAVDYFLRRHRNYEKVAHVGSLLVLRKSAPSRTSKFAVPAHLLALLIEPLLRLETSVRKRIRKRRPKA